MGRQLQRVYDQMKCGGVFPVYKDKENKLVGMDSIPYDANCYTKIMVHDKPYQRIVLHSIYHTPKQGCDLLYLTEMRLAIICTHLYNNVANLYRSITIKDTSYIDTWNLKQHQLIIRQKHLRLCAITFTAATAKSSIFSWSVSSMLSYSLISAAKITCQHDE